MKILACVVAATALLGCDFDDDDDDNPGDLFPPIDEDDDGDVPTPPEDTLQWTATLTGLPPYGTIAGDAIVRQRVDEQLFTASIAIRNDLAGVTRPWHVHFGTCGSGGGIVGDPATYIPLATGADGVASTLVRVEATLDVGADYHVNVHLAPAQLDIIIACGDLVLTP